MSQKLDTVIKDADNLREIVRNLQTVVKENVTLRNKLQDQEKVIEETEKETRRTTPTKTTTKPSQYRGQPNCTTQPPQPYYRRSLRFTTSCICRGLAPLGPSRHALPNASPPPSEPSKQPLVRRATNTYTCLPVTDPLARPQGKSFVTSVSDQPYPGHLFLTVVALLVHVQYQQELTTKFRELNITPMTFNPLDPDHLNDPEYDGLSTMARESVMVGIQNTRMLRTLEHIGAPRSYPVGRFFVQKGWITINELNRLTRRDAARAFRPDDEMEKTRTATYKIKHSDFSERSEVWQ